MKIKVKVIAKSSENRVEYDKENDLYKVKVTVVPEKGKANESVTRLLADYFKTNKSNVSLISGQGSNAKVVEIIREY